MCEYFPSSGGMVKYPNGTREGLKDPDLLWALLGGGGGTFGIVTSFTFKLHRPPRSGFVRYLASYPISVPGKEDVGKQVLEAWNKLLLEKLSDKWGGYVVINGASRDQNGITVKGTITFSLLHFGGYEEALPTVTLLKGIYPQWMLYSITLNHSTFLEYEETVFDKTGFPVYIMNRLLQPEDLARNSGLADDLSSMTDFTDVFIHCTWVVIGGRLLFFYFIFC